MEQSDPSGAWTTLRRNTSTQTDKNANAPLPTQQEPKYHDDGHQGDAVAESLCEKFQV
jgi:hypothetical protein